MTQEVRFPHITVQLTGNDGNAFFVLGQVLKAMTAAHVVKGDRDQFLKEATSGNYDNLLQTVMRWVTVQ